MVFLDYFNSSCLCDLVFNALSSVSPPSLPDSNSVGGFCIGELSLLVLCGITCRTNSIGKGGKHADRSRTAGLDERYMAGICSDICDPAGAGLLHDKSCRSRVPSLIGAVRPQNNKIETWGCRAYSLLMEMVRSIAPYRFPLNGKRLGMLCGNLYTVGCRR